jgi:hypothetical protein
VKRQTVVVTFRCSKPEREAYRRAARRQGFTLSEFVRWWLKEGTLAGKRAR